MCAGGCSEKSLSINPRVRIGAGEEFINTSMCTCRCSVQRLSEHRFVQLHVCKGEGILLSYVHVYAYEEWVSIRCKKIHVRVYS